MRSRSGAERADEFTTQELVNNSRIKQSVPWMCFGFIFVFSVLTNSCFESEKANNKVHVFKSSWG